jgi:hypothetical protein
MWHRIVYCEGLWSAMIEVDLSGKVMIFVRRGAEFVE